LNRVRVVVAGATGKTGSEAAKAVHSAVDLDLVGAVARHHVGQDLGELLGDAPWGLALQDDLEQVLRSERPDVLVDFTVPEVAGGHALMAVRYGVRPVVGTTGISARETDALRQAVAASGRGAIIAPNFSFGIVLLARFCSMALQFFPDVEIIELHHERKLDRPSGTSRFLQGVLERNGAHAPVPIHSVRLPGLLAHHEVIFGGPGETVRLRHDTLSRASFGPGVVLAVRKVVDLDHMVEDLGDLLVQG
jgi:4-hydroxy-tetrahydrodipicolinate reductase